MPIPSRTEDAPRQSLRDQVKGQIQAAIFDGTLEPGENLNDAQLQDWLGVSRQPIREALNDLARIGLIEMAPQRYTRVALPDPNERTAVLQTLGALVGGVVRITVPSITSAQRKSVLGFLDRIIPLVEKRDTHAHGKLGWELVDVFIDYCPNHILVRATREMIDSLAFQLSATRTADNTDWDSLSAGYPALKAAIESGDAIAAELAIEQVFLLSRPSNSQS